MKHRYNLIGKKCIHCGKVMFPPRIMCPHCRRASKLNDFKLAGLGTVHSYTVVYVAPEGYEMLTPYILAIIELKDGPKITTQIVDCEFDKIKIGMPVEMVFRKLLEDGKDGLIHYGYKFRPVLLNNQKISAQVKENG